MAGVYIKDMTLDEFWEDYGEGAAYLCGTGRAIEIPDHGDLIDGNALAELFRSKVEGDKGIGSLMVNLAALCIDNAPVVIPADKGDAK